MRTSLRRGPLGYAVSERKVLHTEVRRDRCACKRILGKFECLRDLDGQQTSIASHVFQRADRQSRSPPEKALYQNALSGTSWLLPFHHSLDISIGVFLLQFLPSICLSLAAHDTDAHLDVPIIIYLKRHTCQALLRFRFCYLRDLVLLRRSRRGCSGSYALGALAPPW